MAKRSTPSGKKGDNRGEPRSVSPMGKKKTASDIVGEGGDPCQARRGGREKKPKGKKEPRRGGKGGRSIDLQGGNRKAGLQKLTKRGRKKKKNEPPRRKKPGRKKGRPGMVQEKGERKGGEKKKKGKLSLPSSAKRGAPLAKTKNWGGKRYKKRKKRVCLNCQKKKAAFPP